MMAAFAATKRGLEEPERCPHSHKPVKLPVKPDNLVCMPCSLIISCECSVANLPSFAALLAAYVVLVSEASGTYSDWN